MPVDIYVEIGTKKTFACAVDWPGWARAGRDEDLAVHALLEYAPRYALATQSLGFTVPVQNDLRIVERLKGTSTTDFGAPDAMLPSEVAAGYRPVGDAGFTRLADVLKACWAEYERIYQTVSGRSLKTGPRGGGRDLRGITYHVLNGAAGYLSKVGGRLKIGDDVPDLLAEWRRANQEILAALELAAKNGVPERGPRGGTNWPLSYFIRRLAWHVLDHAWEIEDRLI